MVYLGNIILACLVITYFVERIDNDSKVNTEEQTWVYFQSNIRLACNIAILGFIGLLVELKLMLIAINETSENKIAYIQLQRLFSPKNNLNETTNTGTGVMETDSTFMEFDGARNLSTSQLNESMALLSPTFRK